MNHNVIRKAVFPVAGLGTRFLPATKAAPKEMLPVVDKPLIQYAVEEAIASGDAAAAQQALGEAAPTIMRAAQKGIVHVNTASRKVSRLTKRVKALAS